VTSIDEIEERIFLEQTQTKVENKKASLEQAWQPTHIIGDATQRAE
jgi:hypothetical protein